MPVSLSATNIAETISIGLGRRNNFQQPCLLPFLDGLIPQFFYDSARIRGLNRVLSTLPAHQRKAIKAVLKDPAQSLLPSTADIWTGWPQLLEDSGLGFLLLHDGSEVPLVSDQFGILNEPVKA